MDRESMPSHHLTLAPLSLEAFSLLTSFLPKVFFPGTTYAVVICWNFCFWKWTTNYVFSTLIFLLNVVWNALPLMMSSRFSIHFPSPDSRPQHRCPQVQRLLQSHDCVFSSVLGVTSLFFLQVLELCSPALYVQ